MSLAMGDGAGETKLSHVEEVIWFYFSLGIYITLFTVVRRQIHHAQVD